MRKYFITGGSGFIGREIVRQLLKRDDTESLVLLTRSAQRRYDMLSWSPKISLLEGDITSVDFPHEGITDLIHGANEANDLRQPDLHQYFYTMVEGTQRVMRWAWQQRLERVTLLSSGAVGRDTVYGKAKRISEWMTTTLLPNASIARIYSVIGEEMPLNGQYAAGIFIWQALNEGRVTCKGGDSIRSYLHVEDVADCVLKMHGYGGAYDCAGPYPMTIRELARDVADVFGVPCTFIEEDVLQRKDVYVSTGTQVVPTMTLINALTRIKDYHMRKAA